MPLTPVDIATLPTPGFLIGGRKITDVGESSHEHRYAATGEVTYRVPLATAREVDLAVQAARKALPIWRRMTPTERRSYMLRFAQLIRDNGERLGRMMMAENGTAFVHTPYSIEWVAELFEYNAGWTDKIGGDVVRTYPAPAFNYTLDEPFGVIAVIVPWNGPFVSFGQTLAPALAAGNTVVIKPPELAPYSCLMLAELAQEAGFPDGVINVIPAGAEGGDALTRHKGVDKIHFTGSGATARKIIAATMENLTPYGLELGGKSARLVFADADRESAVMNAISSAIGGAGQACICASRVLVEKSIYDNFVADCQAAMEKFRPSDPALPDSVMGPVINQAAVDRIMGFVDRANQAGHRLVTGGNRVGGDFADGYFIEPTIYADVDHDSDLARNEVFGPILAFMPFEDEEEAIRLANDSPYGLAAWVESENVTRVHRVSDALEAGTVWVNGFANLPVNAPFGGYKQSGLGRVGGKWGIQEFTQTKNVWVKM